jgi:hypothetical protein
MEALARGKTIVTSDETGLSDWLENNGHKVIKQSDLSENLAYAIIESLLAPLKPDVVYASLPLVDGYSAAMEWLRQ